MEHAGDCHLLEVEELPAWKVDPQIKSLLRSTIRIHHLFNQYYKMRGLKLFLSKIENII